MKKFKFKVTIEVYGGSERDAMARVQDLFGLFEEKKSPAMEMVADWGMEEVDGLFQGTEI
jgi:hypothetical protein